MDTKEDTIEIPMSEYNRLKESEAWLSCLEDAGVDNWSGIEFAIQLQTEEQTGE